MTQAPKINESQSEDILRQVKALVPFYTPEWLPSDEKSPDAALLRIFSEMAAGTVDRLNRAPDKNFIAFLNMLGIKLIPAQSARAPLTFHLSAGAAENVLVPERTQVAAGEIKFETEKNFLTAPAKLAKAYSLNIGSDEIYEAPVNIIEGKTVPAWSAHLAFKANKGQKELFPDDASGLVKGDVIKIRTSYMMVSEVADTMITLTDNLESDFAAGSVVEKVTIFELFQGKDLQEHVLYLGHNILFNIKPAPGAKSELKIGFTVREAAQAGMKFEWSYWGENPATKKDDWVTTLPVSDSTAGFTHSGEILLPVYTEIKETTVNGTKSRWLRCKATSPLSKTMKLPALSAVALVIKNTISPDLAFHNDVPADLTRDGLTKEFKDSLYPFGRTPRLFDAFYLGCTEGFSKKGAEITVKFTTVSGTPGPTVNVPVEEIYGIGPKFASRLKDPKNDITTANELIQHTPEELMSVLKTTKRHLVENIMAAAKLKYTEASRHVAAVTAAKQEEATAGSSDLALSWEYWNGQGWTVLSITSDNTELFTKTGEVVFDCPDDIESTKVSGQDNYWVRARIVSGDYGKEIVYNGTDWVPGTINPPVFKDVMLTYDPPDQPLEQCLALNNLAFVDISEESKTSDKSIKPFRPLEDDHQTIYLGFDKRLKSGPLSIFFALEEAEYIEETMPKIAWQYLAESEQGGQWQRLEVQDGTRNLTRSGTLEFAMPDDSALEAMFGAELCWIRAVDVDNKFQTRSKIYTKVLDNLVTGYLGRTLAQERALCRFMKLMKRDYSSTRETKPSATVLEPCSADIEVFHPAWSYPPEARQYAPNPRVTGVYLNTTWAVQAETMKGEIMGSSDGGMKQAFTLTKTPVVSEEIWVNEFKALSEAGMQDILSKGELPSQVVRNDKGTITEFWLKWQAVEDLLASSRDSRHYEIDRITGVVSFGDGINGAVPPAGTDNIKADYQSGGGQSGNVASATITGLKTSVPFVEKVSNPVAAGGGSDTELLEAAVERGPQVVRHRNRSVGQDDFVWMAKQASPGIARADCLPNFNDQGVSEPGWVTVIIVPGSEEEKPEPSLELKSRVKTYLEEHSANTVVSPEHIQVSGPVYVAVGVETTIITTTMDAIPIVESAAFTRLKAFLHPLTGGYEGKGWDFGRGPCLSDFFALLEKIPGVNYVKSLSVRISVNGSQGTSELVITPEKGNGVDLPDYTLVYSGEHKIKVTFEKES